MSAATGLQLTGLRHAGLMLDAGWQWPEGASTRTFDDILGAVVPFATDRRAALATLELRGTSLGDPTAWWFVHQGSTLSCAINGRAIRAGERQRLEHGDGIEIGLTHVQVWLNAAAVGHSQPAGRAVEDFDLASLDSSRLRSTSHDDGATLHPHADFGDLIALHPEDLAPPDHPGVPAAEPGSRSASADNNPLEALHTRYLAKLRDPLQGDVDHGWQDLERSNMPSAPQAHPLDQWRPREQDPHGFDDLLHPSNRIADLIESLDVLCITDVMAPEPFDNVMHLFAPETLRREAERPGRDLPTLTRREHHSLSADSALPLFPAAGTHPPSPPAPTLQP